MAKRKKKVKDVEKVPEIDNEMDGQGIGEVGCGSVCKVNYLTQRGKRIQLARILCFIFIPLIGVWGFTIFSLFDNVQSKSDSEGAKESMSIVIRMGRLIHKLQKERDMTVLYIGKLGPNTKTFLLRNYEETDEAFSNMIVWPTDFDFHPRPEFRSKNKLIRYISQHRKYLDPAATTTIGEIQFYTGIANQFMIWMIENIRDSGLGAFWKSLVAYQKLTRCALDAGAERAYGVMFYSYGGFVTWEDFELYNKRIHSFKIHYSSAVSYSPLVNPLLDDDAIETDATMAINRFRVEIRRSGIDSNNSFKSLEKAEWLFDNMTIRIDSLFTLQEQIAEKISDMLEGALSETAIQIAIYAFLVCLAILICPVIIYFSESLTSNFARYSRILMEKSNELDEEKYKSETILYQMIPKTVAERLKKTSSVDSEFFKSVTLMFSSIVDFTKLTRNFSAMELVDMLNYLYTYFDEKIEDYDVYKVETINDTYLLASGLPVPNGDKHVSEIGYFAVDVGRKINQIGIMHGQNVQLLIGISTGPVSAGIVGTVMIRYCVFGDTVNIASRMMSCGTPNKIHVSESTYKKLRATGNFKLQSRGTIEVKGKGPMKTFWLLDSFDDVKNNEVCTPTRQAEPTKVRYSPSDIDTQEAEPKERYPPSNIATQGTVYEPQPSGSTRKLTRMGNYTQRQQVIWIFWYSMPTAYVILWGSMCLMVLALACGEASLLFFVISVATACVLYPISTVRGRWSMIITRWLLLKEAM